MPAANGTPLAVPNEGGSKGLALGLHAAGILFSGELWEGPLVMGAHHASYRAIPQRSLLLLPTLRRALFGDVFAAIEERLYR